MYFELVLEAAEQFKAAGTDKEKQLQSKAQSFSLSMLNVR